VRIGNTPPEGLELGVTCASIDNDVTANDERRIAPRYELDVAVTFESQHNFFAGLTRDLSSGGLFIATSVLRPIGECVRVRLTLPGSDEVLDAITEVRWVRQGGVAGAMEPGMGLEFLQMSPRTKQAIKDFKDKRETFSYDDE
jgi:uncharacterized protein (TIGR02266 family)